MTYAGTAKITYSYQFKHHDVYCSQLLIISSSCLHSRNMRTALTILCVITFFCTFGSAQLPSSQVLRCRQCVRATTLSDCNRMVTCDNTIEDCYMDQLITDQLTIVYNGGCRSKQVCGLQGRKRDDLVSCSNCCNFAEDCNKRLCGIKDDTLTSSQCYSCDHRSSDQSEVKDPSQCITLDTCQTNEVCYATQSDVAGESVFFYGCLSKLQCSYLMERAYNDYKVCVLNNTAPPNGLTWDQACGNAHSRATSLCHSCCADGGCNYGTCHELNERIFKLADQGKFDFRTLKIV